MENWQKEHISKNLDDLMEVTSLNAYILAVLCSQRVLESKDIWELEAESNEGMRNIKFYEIMKEKQVENIYNILISAFEKSYQSGVSSLLKRAAVQIIDEMKPSPAEMAENSEESSERLPQDLNVDELVPIIENAHIKSTDLNSTNSAKKARRKRKKDAKKLRREQRKAEMESLDDDDEPGRKSATLNESDCTHEKDGKYIPDVVSEKEYGRLKHEKKQKKREEEETRRMEKLQGQERSQANRKKRRKSKQPNDDVQVETADERDF